MMNWSPQARFLGPATVCPACLLGPPTAPCWLPDTPQPILGPSLMLSRAQRWRGEAAAAWFPLLLPSHSPRWRGLNWAGLPI